jgi:1-acyl-sn-glycerol-3-phosphate acyltransferase
MPIFLRTLIFWVTTFSSLLFFFPFIFIFRSRKKAIQKIGRFWGNLLLFVSGVHLNICGLENIDPQRSYIIMANHQSYHDIFLLLTLPVFIHWMAKKELFRMPVFGWILKWIDAISIDRGNKAKTYSSIKNAVEKIRSGATVLIFPEGTRSPTGYLLPFNKGGFSLAILSRSPILPITIYGTHNVMPKGSLMVHPSRVKVLINPPIETKSLNLRDRDQLMEHVQKLFQQNLNRIKNSLPKMLP